MALGHPEGRFSMTVASSRTPAGWSRLVALYLGLAIWMMTSSPTFATLAFGLPLIAVGECIRIWAAGYLTKTRELVTAGPYRFVRHPLYLGRLLIFSGLALAASLPMGVNYVLMILGWLLFFGYYLPRKEAVEPSRLRVLHGPAYDAYHRATPAIAPRWPTPSSPERARGWSRARWNANREGWMALALALLVGLLAWKASGHGA